MLPPPTPFSFLCCRVCSKLLFWWRAAIVLASGERSLSSSCPPHWLTHCPRSSQFAVLLQHLTGKYMHAYVPCRIQYQPPLESHSLFLVTFAAIVSVVGTLWGPSATTWESTGLCGIPQGFLRSSN